MNTQECDILNLILSNTYTNQRTLAEDSGHSLGIVNRSIKTLIAEGYLDESIQPTPKASGNSQRLPQKEPLFSLPASGCGWFRLIQKHQRGFLRYTANH